MVRCPNTFLTGRCQRQRDEMGTLGSGNHYLEVQRVAQVFEPEVARALSIAEGDVVVSIHCGSRGLGHQIGTEYLREMAIAASAHGIDLPDTELACAPLRSEVGMRYLGAMRAGINCALANRQIITHLTRQVFDDLLPQSELPLLYDVSHNTCKEESHVVDGVQRQLFVHRKGATRAFGPGHPELPEQLRHVGQPVLIGGSMGTESWVLVGTNEGMTRSFGSACHGAGRRNEPPPSEKAVAREQADQKPRTPRHHRAVGQHARRRGRGAGRLQGRSRRRRFRRSKRTRGKGRSPRTHGVHQGLIAL